MECQWHSRRWNSCTIRWFGPSPPLGMGLKQYLEALIFDYQLLVNSGTSSINSIKGVPEKSLKVVSMSNSKARLNGPWIHITQWRIRHMLVESHVQNWLRTLRTAGWLFGFSSVSCVERKCCYVFVILWDDTNIEPMAASNFQWNTLSMDSTPLSKSLTVKRPTPWLQNTPCQWCLWPPCRWRVLEWRHCVMPCYDDFYQHWNHW